MGKVSGFILPIIMALAILVYTTLAVLAFATARADDNFADRNIQFNQAYYEAQTDFARTYAELDGFLLEMEKENLGQAKILAEVEENFKEIQIMEKGAIIVFEYGGRVSENTLYHGQMHYRDGQLQVVAEGVVNAADWEEEYYELWNG